MSKKNYKENEGIKRRLLKVRDQHSVVLQSVINFPSLIWYKQIVILHKLVALIFLLVCPFQALKQLISLKFKKKKRRKKEKNNWKYGKVWYKLVIRRERWKTNINLSHNSAVASRVLCYLYKCGIKLQILHVIQRYTKTLLTQSIHQHRIIQLINFLLWWLNQTV